ncbi:putative Polycomb group protein ASXL2 isoform X1 [Pseudonaja textilis]|uniref:putative Polycomb group protein ASXL2 isoform X1 n=1 Tax=Pseudonaja textilis TaxID=8673 RepID=UPI000EA995EE|nr:putative Polycomb group protein ASXL2 isoform X1 [Pseudonaja textilis]
MSHKEILQVIQKEGLKEIRSGTSPLACLNAMLHTNSRGDEGIFYKVPGRMGVYTLKKDVPDGLKDLSEGSEESSDIQSDSPSSESSSSSSSDQSSNKEGRKSRWQRKVSARLSQVSSPQPGCPSPSIPPGKIISSSQKHSKKALKQALKQKQRKQHHCRTSVPVSTNHHLLQQHMKIPNHPAKAAWEGKQSDGHSSSPQNSTSSSSPSVKTEPSLPILGKKPFQRSERLHARQLKRTKCAEIDVETPESILVNTNLRALINKHTFMGLPVECQQKLLLLLPEVDRQIGMDGLMKLSSSALNNEFFNSAAQGWKERLSEGEFTPEMQLRLRQELEKEKKVEFWKEHFFESYYGQSSGLSLEESKQLISCIPTVQNQAQTGNLAPQLQKCIVVHKAVSDKEQTNSLMGPKVHVLPAITAAAKGEEIEQPKVLKPEELLNSSGNIASIQSSSQIPQKISKRVEEPEEVTPQPAYLESVVRQNPSKPKNAAIAGTKPSPEVESQEISAKEVPATCTEQMDTGSRAFKRKSEIPEEALMTPEKQLHVTEKCPTRPPFQAPLQCFPIAPTPKVPPLRIHVSRIQGSPALLSASQVSPRPPFPIIRRTGARTLADVKARARMARAQRAAAAAEAAAAASIATTSASIVEAIPGPGPGGGKGEDKSSPLSGRPQGATLDMADFGNRTSPKRVFPSRPAPSSPADSPAPEPAATSSAARAQLQPAPPAQSRTASSNPEVESASISQPAIGSVSCTNPSLLTVPATRDVTASLGSTVDLASMMEKLRNSPLALNQVTRTSSGFEPGVNCKSISKTASTTSTGVSEDKARALLSVSPVLAESIKAPPLLSSPRGTVPMSTLSPPSCNTLLVAHSPKVPPGSSGSNGSSSAVKSSSSIPANNPLVAQLLQGKEVPMEQMLPRPLTRVDIKSIAVPVKEGKATTIVSRSGPPREGEGQLHVAFPAGGKPSLSHCGQSQDPPPFSSLSGQDLWSQPTDLHSSQETLGKSAQEHILQTVMRKVPVQSLPTAPSPPPRLPLLPPHFPVESSSASQSFTLGFIGRRTFKPAMSGHYLLNVSTYGRCPENLRRNLAVPPEEPPEKLEEQKHTSKDESNISGGEDEGFRDGNVTEHATAHLKVKEESLAPGRGRGRQATSNVKVEQAAISHKDGNICLFPAGQDYAENNAAKDFIQAAQEQVAQTIRGERRSCSGELQTCAPANVTPQRPLLLSPSPSPQLFGNPTPTQLIGPGYSGTINVSTSPDMHQDTLLTGLSDPSHMGDVVSFSVTVTAIPAGHSANTGSHGQALRGQAFVEGGGLEDLPTKCYCRLKAMIVCKGCGAFCHDDCIGPSKLCVSCLVVR